MIFCFFVLICNLKKKKKNEFSFFASWKPFDNLVVPRLKKQNPDYLKTISSADLFLVSIMVASKEYNQNIKLTKNENLPPFMK